MKKLSIPVWSSLKSKYNQFVSKYISNREEESALLFQEELNKKLLSLMLPPIPDLPHHMYPQLFINEYRSYQMSIWRTASSLMDAFACGPTTQVVKKWKTVDFSKLEDGYKVLFSAIEGIKKIQTELLVNAKNQDLQAQLKLASEESSKKFNQLAKTIEDNFVQTMEKKWSQREDHWSQFMSGIQSDKTAKHLFDGLMNHLEELKNNKKQLTKIQ